MARHTKSKHKPSEDLLREWYEKLKDSGFDDIENPFKDDQNIKAWHSFDFAAIDPIYFEAKAEYYLKASKLLHRDDTFYSKTERHIWELHCEGVSCRKIAELVLPNEPIRLNKDKVQKTIARLRKLLSRVDDEVESGALCKSPSLF